MNSMTAVAFDNIDGEENDHHEVVSEQKAQDNDGQERHEEPTRRTSCCQKFGNRFPRLFAIAFGIILPVCFLVVLCSVFGYWIAQIESPVEILQNDATIASYVNATRTLQLLSNLTSVSPKVCLTLFLNNITTETLMTYSLWDLLNGFFEKEPSATATVVNYTSTEMLYQFKSWFDTIPEKHNNSELVDIERSFTDMYNFMNLCGENVSSFIFKESDISTIVHPGESESAALDFAWNRCTPYSFLDQQVFTLSLHPFNQTIYYAEAWGADEERLFEQYYKNYTTTMNVSSTFAMLLARQKSVAEATGEAACDVNVFAGAWFWFTIMSTIGYGNAAIETVYGRTLIYTFGFLSILLFGGILLCAGAVTVAIFKDCCIQWKVPFLTAPWLASIVWGSLYYTWMCVIASYYAGWNAERLGTSDVGFKDGFWFAYISTTTIGLGDFILQPAVLVATDIFYWPLNFLMGFVLFSAFICNLSAVAMKPAHKYTRNLALRLEKTNMFFGTPTFESREDVYVHTSLVDRRSSVEESNAPTQPLSEPTLRKKETERF